MHAVDGRFHAGVSREQDDCHERELFSDLPERFETVHAGHLHVQDHHVHSVVVGQSRQGLLAVKGLEKFLKIKVSKEIYDDSLEMTPYSNAITFQEFNGRVYWQESN